MMQHMHDYVLNATQNFVRDEVPTESNDHLSDDHSDLRVSDEIDHFLAHNNQERFEAKFPAEIRVAKFLRTLKILGRSSLQTRERASR